MATKKEARNARRDAKNVHAPRGKHWCHMHNGGEGAYLKFEFFHKNKKRYHGLNDRCKACSKEYRERYEAEHGKRTDQTKTFRVPTRVHAVAKEAARARRVYIPEIVGAALKFYLKYGCRREACLNPAGATGLCDRHALSLTMNDAA